MVSDRPIYFYFSLVAMVCMAAFSIDVSIPAIPMIREYYGLTDGLAQLVVGSYLLGFTVGQIPVGILSDRFGRRPILLCGLVSFIFFAALCLFAENIYVLFFARFMQGLSGAVGPVLSRAIARDVAVNDSLLKLLSLFVSALAVTTLIAPVIGGWLVVLLGWWAPFMSSLVFGVLVFVLAYFFVAESREKPVDQGQILTQFLKSVKSFTSARECIVGALLVGFLFMGYMAFVASYTSVLVDVYSIKTVYLGILFSLPVVAYLFGSWLFGKLSPAFSVGGVVKMTMLLLLVEFFIMSAIIVVDQIPLALLCVLLLPYFLALGMLQPCANMLALSAMGESAGAASSLMGTTQILSGSLGAFLAATFYLGNYSSMISVMLVAVLGLLSVYVFGYRNILSRSV